MQGCTANLQLSSSDGDTALTVTVANADICNSQRKLLRAMACQVRDKIDEYCPLGGGLGVTSQGRDMPGPWIVGKENPGFIAGLPWPEGSIWEVHTYGGDGKAQGRLLVEVLESPEQDKNGKWNEVLVVCIEDVHLAWWFESGAGKKLDYTIRLHGCLGEFKKCKAVNARSSKDFHTDQVRNMDWDDVRHRRSAWWLSKHNKKSFEEWRRVRLAEHGAAPAGGALEDDRNFGASEYEASGDEGVEEQKQMEHKAELLKEQLEDLKAKAAAINKGKAVKKRPKAPQEEVEEPPTKKKKATPSKDAEKKKVDVPGKPVVWFGRNKGEEKAAKKPKVTSSSSDEKKKKKKRKKQKKEDRGPYGVGRRVKYGKESSDQSGSSSDESLFQGGVPEKRAQQLILLEYSERKPGRLTARLLQKMARLLSHSGTPFNPNQTGLVRTPSVATPYLQTVLLPTYKDKIQLRLIRELRTLCLTLDLLAAGSIEQAGDVVSQRIKALELVVSDGTWARGQFLELVPAEGAGLAEPEEQRMASREQALETKLRSALGTSWRKEEPEMKGKGKGQKGRKGDKGTWDRAKKNDKKESEKPPSS
eukprot:Skav210165  [mRNA]  locus=scaffold5301:46312:49159:- [translate_table: standard]